MEAESKLYRYMAAGLFVIFSFHTLVNLFVAVGLMPNTGMPLPFISFGRSAMLLCLAGVALLINIRSRERRLVFNR
jgi:rod shape determining protein RodA